MGKKAKKKARTPPKEQRSSARFEKDVPQESTGPTDETVSDVVSVQNEKRPCSHVDKGFNLTALSEKLGSSEPIRCEDCREGAIDRRGNKGKGKHGKKKGSVDAKSESRAIWMCLQCGHYGCGGVGFPTVPQSHAVRHARLTRHRLTMQIENPSLRWCFPCSAPLSVEKTEDLGEHKDYLGEAVKLIKGRSAKSSKADVEDIWFGVGSVLGEMIQKPEVAASSSLDSSRSGGHVVRGLANLGNTCFFNSVVQNLLAMDRLRDHFLASETSSLGPLTISLKKLFSDIKGEAGARNVINPRSLFGSLCSKAPQFRGYQQHDSHELLRCLLDILSTEEFDMNKRENSCEEKSSTFIDSVFGGQISSTVCCTKCGHSSTVYEPFLDLSLPVPTKKLIPKKSQAVSRAKKAKMMPKRGSRPRAKAYRDASLSTSTNDLQPLDEGLEASVSSSYDSWVQNSPIANDKQDVKDDEKVKNVQLSEVPPEKTAGVSIEEFSWLDYLESAEDLSVDISFSVQDNNCVVDENGDLANASTSMEFCPEAVSDDVGSNSVYNNDAGSDDQSPEYDHAMNMLYSQNAGSYKQDVKDDENVKNVQLPEVSTEKTAGVSTEDFSWLDYVGSTEDLSVEINFAAQDNSCVVDEKGDLGNASTCMEYLCPGDVSDNVGSNSINNNDVASDYQRPEYDHAKNMYSQNACEDEEPLPSVQDSEVLLLPYREDDIQASAVTSREGQGDTSLGSSNIGQDESADFDGFGDLFAEPEIPSGPVGDSSLGDDSKTGFAAGIGSDSDPGEIDDSDSPVSVETCLAHFTKAELLSKDNAWHCEKCSKAVQFQQLNKTRKKKMVGESCDNGSVDESEITLVIPEEISCNGNTEDGLSCSENLVDSGGSNSMKLDDSVGDKGDLEKEITKPDFVAEDRTGETHLDGKPEDGSRDNECEEVEKAIPSVKVKRDATKRVLVFKAPPILTVHLKRFSQDARGRLSKLSGHVIFREVIDLSPYIDSRGKEQGKCVYRLVGVVEHLGTMQGGHYVAYVRGGGSVWYHASDASVHEVSLEEVLRCDAYILFYELI